MEGTAKDVALKYNIVLKDKILFIVDEINQINLKFLEVLMDYCIKQKKDIEKSVKITRKAHLQTNRSYLTKNIDICHLVPKKQWKIS